MHLERTVIKKRKEKQTCFSNGTEALVGSGSGSRWSRERGWSGLTVSGSITIQPLPGFLFGNPGISRTRRRSWSRLNYKISTEQFPHWHSQDFIRKRKPRKNRSNVFFPFFRRLLAQETVYADNTRHYGFYIDGDIAKLPGGGRKGAAVLCELLPDQLAADPAQQVN